MGASYDNLPEVVENLTAVLVTYFVAAVGDCTYRAGSLCAGALARWVIVKYA